MSLMEQLTRTKRALDAGMELKQMNYAEQRAIEYLSAKPHGDSWRYFEQADGHWYLIADHELLVFGQYLLREEDKYGESDDHFERWLEDNEGAVTKMGANS